MRLLRKYELFFKAWAVPMNNALAAILLGLILPRVETRLIREFFSPGSALRLGVPFPKWEDFMRLALDEISFYGANSVQVMRRTNAMLNHLHQILPEERHAALRQWDQRLKLNIRSTFENAQQQRDASESDRQGLGISQE
jgi:uncharacterized membrane protein